MSKNKFKPAREWFNQADYDLKTADAMFRAGRYIYTVFMCHLSIEKALKGLYAKQLKKDPPKIHNLNYLCEKIGLELSEEYQDFIDNLNNLSVPTRYPDELEKLLQDYKKDLTGTILDKTEELLLWLKKKKL
jgi:HEPN domain-containing protein